LALAFAVADRETLTARSRPWSPAWAIPGAIIQALGGPKRRLGVLLSNELPIGFPIAGWAVMAGIVCRAVWEGLIKKGRAETTQIFGAGVIAGDALFAFFNSTARNFPATH